MVRYAWSDPAFVKNGKKANPQRVGEVIEELRQQNQGEKLTDAMWQAARDNPSHPLFSHYDWDKDVASVNWWREQSRRLIRAIIIVDARFETPQRAFLSIPDEERRAWHSFKEVISSEELREAHRRALIKELEEVKTRYRDFEDVCAVLETAIKRARKPLENRPRT